MWEKLIQDLLDSGLTETEIAEEVGVKQPTINRLKNGQPSTLYATGEAIKKLHKRRCKGKAA